MYQPPENFFGADFVSDRTFFSSNRTFFQSIELFFQAIEFFRILKSKKSEKSNGWLKKKLVASDRTFGSS